MVIDMMFSSGFLSLIHKSNSETDLDNRDISIRCKNFTPFNSKKRMKLHQIMTDIL